MTVVVPLDGSEEALRAVDVGVELARADDAELLLVTTPMTTDEPRMPVWLPEAANNSGYDRVRTEFFGVNDPIAAIGHSLEVSTAPVLCMATHGRGALGTAILGSVAQRAVRQLRVDTVLVGPNVDPTWTVQGPVLACHDGSRHAACVVPSAERWAVRLGVELVVVHVAHPLDVPRYGAPTEAIDAALAEIDHRPPAEKLRVVTDRHVPAGILGIADDVVASLIAVATHGHTGDARAVLGGVAGAVIHAAACPVLVARPSATAVVTSPGG
jgi:nucleotide-binding universal stress UspA family protein